MSTENLLQLGKMRKNYPQIGTGPRYDEHFIGDRCPASVHSGVTTNAADFFNWARDRLQFLRERRILREFKKRLQTGTESLATFTEGVEFDPNAYPVGTILRMAAQLDIYETNFPYSIETTVYEPSSTTKEEWQDRKNTGQTLGIVAAKPGTHANCVIQLPDELDVVSVNQNKVVGHKLLESRYTIGSWRHQVWISGESYTIYDRGLQLSPPIYFAQTAQDDIFYRVTQIDVLHLGRGDRRRAKVRFRKPSLFLGKQTETA